MRMGSEMKMDGYNIFRDSVIVFGNIFFSCNFWLVLACLNF